MARGNGGGRKVPCSVRSYPFAFLVTISSVHALDLRVRRSQRSETEVLVAAAAGGRRIPTASVDGVLSWGCQGNPNILVRFSPDIR